MDSYDYDLYQFWDDIEYVDDEYWDYDGRQRPGQHLEQTGQKRKRGMPPRKGATDKRRKVSGTQAAAVGGLEAAQADMVLFMSRAERNRLAARPAPILKDRVAVAFLADWRERFADRDGEIMIASMPADMQHAAQAKDEDTPQKAMMDGAGAMAMVDEGEGEWEDEDAEDDAESGDALAALDPEMLKMILKQKLGDAGLEGIDEAAFIATLNKMLAGNEDEAADDLAHSLLGQATTDGGDSALSGWLSQQGVSMDSTQDDDTASVATAELPEGTGRPGQSVHISPPDSAISVPETKQMALHLGSPTSTQNGMPVTTRQQTSKKKKTGKRVTFDVPPSSEEATQDSAAAAEAESAAPDAPPTSEDPLMSEPNIAATATRATKSKRGASSSTVKSSARATAKRPQPNDQLQEELDESLKGDEAAATQSVRSTRKRKAPVEDAEAVNGADDGTKPRAMKEAATRKTRSARAKTGK